MCVCVWHDSLFHCTNSCSTSTSDSGGVLPRSGGAGEEGRGGGRGGGKGRTEGKEEEEEVKLILILQSSSNDHCHTLFNCKVGIQ